MDRRLILLIGLSLIVYSANIWVTSLYVLDEAKNAGCAMEMRSRHDWVVPTFNGELRGDKPPLHYFFMKAAFFLTGVNAFSARIFSVVMGMLMVVSVYWYGRKFLNETAAFLTALMLVVSLQLAVQFHLAVPDPYLIFFLTFGLLNFYHGYQRDSKYSFYLFYCSISLAALAKGPVAVVFSGLIVFVFLLTQRRFSLLELTRIKLLQGILIFCVVVLPWYVMVGIETDGEWLRLFFLEHNVQRFTSAMEGHGGFPLESFVILLFALLPFSVFAPQALRYSWKNRKENSFLVFCLVATFVVTVFFAFSRTILPSYPEPAVPFFAIILGAFLAEKISAKDSSYNFTVNAVIYLLVAAIIPVAAWFALKQDETLSSLADFAWYCCLLTVGGVWGVIMIIKKQLLKALYGYVVCSILFLMAFFYIVHPAIDQQNPVRHCVTTLDKSLPIKSYKDFNPAFVFGLKRVIPVVDRNTTVNPSNSFYVITQKRYLAEFDGTPYTIVCEGRDLFENTTTVVIELGR